MCIEQARSGPAAHRTGQARSPLHLASAAVVVTVPSCSGVPADHGRRAAEQALQTHERFADFITTPPLAGLGSDIELVERIVAADAETVRLLRTVLYEKPGPKGSVDNIHRTTKGTSRSYSLQLWFVPFGAGLADRGWSGAVSAAARA